MNCPDWLQLLQRRLDGELPGGSADWDQHLAACPTCRELHVAARRLEAGLLSRSRIALPPPGLTERLVAAVLQDQQARTPWRRGLLVGALAASLLLAAYLGYAHWRRPSVLPAPQGPALAHREQPGSPLPAGPSLDQDVEEAGSALASLTRRAAGETFDQGRRLLVDITPTPRSNDTVQPAEPPTRSLRAAGQGVSTGLEPMADSARRAVNLFLRDFEPLEPENPGL